MNFKNILTDDDAVSPVIGVILMVAITVILAAVIGTFVLGLGDQVSNTSPTASFTFDYDGSATPGATASLSTTLVDNNDDNSGSLTITHDGGDGIEASQLAVTDGSSTIGGDSGNAFADWSGTVSAGSSNTEGVDDDDTVRVTWASSNGGDTATLGKWSGPEAN